ncbi:MAG: putative zinc-binding metallopeptidase [Chloroflexota bacterium]
MSLSDFRETTRKNVPNREQQELLSCKISDLSLKIQGTRLESLISKLYQELEQAGISFKPKTYLADEWGCPHGVPVIGIPFYLANPELSKLEGELTGIESEDETEVMMYLRHEAGHAFNYAYHLYRKTEWRQLFGRFSQPYRDNYQPVPFSAKFVRHIPGWYAQKHPDEDFAETFAVWLTPGSDWQRQYADTLALAKLMYVDKMVRKYGQKPPVATDEKLDTPVQELTMTLDRWYETGRDTNHISLNLHRTLNNDLRRLFPAEQGQPAVDVLRANRKQLIQEVNHWTGINRKLLSALTDELLERVQFLRLKIEPRQTATRILSVSAFITTLVMNYLYRGQFIDT